MQDDVRASLEDLAMRWETPRGRELRTQVLDDARRNGGRGIPGILKDFLYVSEVVHGMDLRCITLDGEDLSDAQFEGVDLSWASLANCNLQRANLKKANLKRANLSGCNLALARLDQADCSRADFSKAMLDGTHFSEAKLTGAVLEGADASRASFESANLAKANFLGAQLEQTNFHNADCNNCNFGSTAMDQVAAQPAKAWGVRYDMDREEFEKQVGLRAITSRTTKRFKGLDVLLKAQATMDAADKKPVGSDGESEGGNQAVPYFGAAPIGTRKFKPSELQGLEMPMSRTEGDPSERPTRAQRITRPLRPAPGTGGLRRRPPPPRRPGAPPPGRPPRRPPADRRPGTGAERRPPSGTGAERRPPSATGAQRRPPTEAHRVPPPPPLPIAPFDPTAADPSTDWAKAIGQLMQMKGSISKIVVELGDKSVILYKDAGPS